MSAPTYFHNGQPIGWWLLTKYFGCVNLFGMVEKIGLIEGVAAAPQQTDKAGGIGPLVTALRALAGAEGRLPAERDLSRQLGVNRHTLRQGLQFLRDGGELEPAKIRAASGKSFKILNISKETSPVEVWETRLLIEPHIARAAALRATPREIDSIREAHRLASPDVFDLGQDIDFHRRVAAASHNTLWTILIDLLTDLTREESFLTQLPPFTSVTGYDHHEDVMLAIVARDAVAAEKAMYAHVVAIQRWVMGLPRLQEPQPE